MERLRQNDERNDEGQLVVRKDGSTAIKKRVRRRRSDQPDKEQSNKGRKWRVVQLLLFTGVLVSSLVFVLGVLFYHNSKAFDLKLEEGIEEWAGVKVKIDKLRVLPSKVKASSVHLSGEPGSLLKEMKIKGVNGDNNPLNLIRKTWNSNYLRAKEAKLLFQTPSSEASVSSKSSLLGQAENLYHYKSYNIDQLDISSKKVRGAKPVFTIQNTTFSLKPKLEEPSQVLLSRGHLEFLHSGRLTLERGVFDIEKEEIEIKSLYLSDAQGIGEIKVSGSLPLSAEAQPILDLEIKRIGTESILGALISELFIGDFSGEGELELSYQDRNETEMNFNWKSSNLELMNFSFLRGLQELTGDSTYSKPYMGTKASGVLKFQKGVYSLENLELERKGVLKILGRVEYRADQRLSGQLRVGIPEVRAFLPQSKKAHPAFSPPKNGYVWVGITLSGTPTSPKDNFRDVMASPYHESSDYQSETFTEDAFELLTE